METFSSISTRMQNRAILIISLIAGLLFAVYIKGEINKRETESYKSKTIVASPVERSYR